MLSYDIPICRVSAHNDWQVVSKQLASFFFGNTLVFLKELFNTYLHLQNFLFADEDEKNPILTN
jgi:hypothetical protein